MHRYSKSSKARNDINVLFIYKGDSWPHSASALPLPEISMVTCCRTVNESGNYYSTRSLSFSPGLRTLSELLHD